jgi:hypothetical protein
MKIEQQTKNNFLPAASSNRDRIRLIWHRRDLRLHDNELYHYDDQLPTIRYLSRKGVIMMFSLVTVGASPIGGIGISQR